MKKDNWAFPRHIHYERKLKNVSGEWFADQGFPVRNKMKYILANRDDWPKNIILPEAAQYIQDQKSINKEAKRSYPIHKYIHHGLSSQALSFNLVGLLIVRNDLGPLKNSLEMIGLSGLMVILGQPLNSKTETYLENTEDSPRR